MFHALSCVTRALLLLLAVACFGLHAFAQSPQVMTDKSDYYPFETVYITGTGFHPGEVVTLQVTALDGSLTWDWGLPWDVYTDEAGNFTAEWPVFEWALGHTFLLTADCEHPGESHLHAETTFTDSPKVGSVTVGNQVPAPVVAGNAAHYSITVNRGSGSGSAGNVNINLAVTSTLPDGVTAFFSPNPVIMPPAQDSVTATLILSTTAATPPGITAFTVRATKDTSMDYAEGEGFLEVIAGNTAPVLGAIGDKTVDEETELTFTATATDEDLPANTLTFSLIDTPAGASIDGSTGVFTWTPTEAQGPGSYTFTVRVTDNGEGALYDEEEITVTVNEVNVAPVLGAIGNKSVDEETELTFTATATDQDLPANTLTFSLLDAPAGASINSSTGVFTWIPTEAQGPGSYTFTVRVTDNGEGALYDEEEITVTVNEVNVAPVLGAIGNKSVHWGELLTFTATATDQDVPANTLTFSLICAPAGASIDGATGVFTWTPGADPGPGSYTFTVRVTDNGKGALYDEEEITVTVEKRDTAIAYTGSSAQYSDPAGVSATLMDEDDIPISGRTINFVIGSQSDSDTTDTAGLASTGIVIDQAPGTCTLTITFAGDDLYEPCYYTGSFTILPEDAVAYYTGLLFTCTSSLTGSTAQVTLSATIKDISAVTATDTWPGDIRNAVITFGTVDGGTFTPIASVPLHPAVQLLSPADTTVGTATCNWTVDLGAADSREFTIAIQIGGHYCGPETPDLTVVTVSRLQPGSITGGGHLVNLSSAGQYAGDAGEKTNFGFNVKYQKNGKEQQGQVNIIIWHADRTYQIKSDRINSLSVNTAGRKAPASAAFTAGVSLTDVTDPLNPILIADDATLQLTMCDNGEPGTKGATQDTLGITVWNNDGSLLFSSNWNGTQTVEQPLDGGNLQIH